MITIKNKKTAMRSLITTLAAVITGLLAGYLIAGSSSGHSIKTPAVQTSTSSHAIWTCSMHPQIRSEGPGQCPICGMDLIPLETNTANNDGTDANEIQMSEAAIKLAQIQTSTVQKTFPNKEIQLFGKIKPDERNISELTARFGGRIETLFVNFTGQEVSKGEKLATIYSPELVTAQKELIESVAYKNSNPELYMASRNKLKLWNLSESQVDGIETTAEPKYNFDLLSPIAGTVTQRHVSAGDYVNEGTPLFQIINLKKVWVMFEAYENDLMWLRKNDAVTFTVHAIPGQKFSGKVSHIDPFLDTKTRIANVRVEVDNSDLKLKPGMFVNGQIQPSLSNSRKELLIPKTAVLWTGKKSVVYVKVPNREDVTFLYREIILGAEAGDAYIVKKGLNEGEEIAVNGVFKIDAAAQLHGKTSMMNPPETMTPHSHNHTNGAMTGDPQADHAGMNMHGKPDHEESSAAKHESHTMQTHLKHTMFRVSGNCAMCKSTIETATTNLYGVNTADWNMETKQIEVSFNPDKVTIDDIHTAIAAAGYDTDKMTADETIYNNLPECCKYER